MTDRELTYVTTIAKEGSISAAARRLFVAQPSLSQAVSRLEAQLGVALFQRGPSGLRLTYAGEKYIQCAARILKAYGELEAELSDMSSLRTGRIHLGVTHHLGSTVLPRVLPEFAKRCPGVELRVTEGDTHTLEDALVMGELDFAILHALSERGVPQLQYDLLAHEPFVAVLSREDPVCRQAKPQTSGYPLLDLALLADHPFILLRPEQRIRHVTDVILARAGISPHIRLTLRSFETAEALASEGMGVTLLPADYVGLVPCPKEPAIFAIDPALDPGWSLCIATLRGGYLSQADEYLLSLLRARCSGQ